MTEPTAPVGATPRMELRTSDAEPVPVRDAATVMVLRDSAAGLEVCMLRRNLRSDFVGGAYVFPGGGVDPEDAHDDLAEVVAGLDDATASRQVEVAKGGLAFWVAAIRESFEEAGLLLAYDTDGEIVRFDDPERAERFVEHRREVDDGRRRLVEVCAAESLRLAADGIHYFSRWITPLGAPRRYDTRFFVTAAPDGQVPVHDDREVIEATWVRPADALERQRQGQFEMIFPTIRTLEALSRFDTAGAVLDHAAHIGRIEPILPRIVEADGGLRIVLPGDRQYDAITAQPIDP
jgi:8-oxo-dGTP pyrophosphatase MutT (NUDIX family)